MRKISTLVILIIFLIFGCKEVVKDQVEYKWSEKYQGWIITKLLNDNISDTNELPKKIINSRDPVVGYGDELFKNNQSLKTLTLDSNIKFIGKSAFENTRISGSLYLENVEEVGSFAFAKTDISEYRISTKLTKAGKQIIYPLDDIKDNVTVDLDMEQIDGALMPKGEQYYYDKEWYKALDKNNVNFINSKPFVIENKDLVLKLGEQGLKYIIKSSITDPNKPITITSSDPDLIEVRPDGIVTLKEKVGKAIIKVEQNGRSESFEVEVLYSDASLLRFADNTITGLAINESVDVSITLEPFTAEPVKLDPIDGLKIEELGKINPTTYNFKITLEKKIPNFKLTARSKNLSKESTEIKVYEHYRIRSITLLDTNVVLDDNDQITKANINYTVSPEGADKTDVDFSFEGSHDGISIENGVVSIDAQIFKSDTQSYNIKAVSKKNSNIQSDVKKLLVSRPEPTKLELQVDSNVIVNGSPVSFRVVVTPKNAKYMAIPDILDPISYQYIRASYGKIYFKRKSIPSHVIKMHAINGHGLVSEDVFFTTEYKDAKTIEVNYKNNRNEIAYGDVSVISSLSAKDENGSSEFTQKPVFTIIPDTGARIDEMPDGSYHVVPSHTWSEFTIEISSKGAPTHRKIYKSVKSYSSVDSLKISDSFSKIEQLDQGPTLKKISIETMPLKIKEGVVTYSLSMIDGSPVPSYVSVTQDGNLSISEAFDKEELDLRLKISALNSEGQTLSDTKVIKIYKPQLVSLNIVGSDKVTKGSDESYTITHSPENSLLGDITYSIDSNEENKYLTLTNNTLSFKEETVGEAKVLLTANSSKGKSASKEITTAYVPTASIDAQITGHSMVDAEIVNPGYLVIQARALDENSSDENTQKPIINITPKGIATLQNINGELRVILNPDYPITDPENMRIEITSSGLTQPFIKDISVRSSYTKLNQITGLTGDSIITLSDEGSTVGSSYTPVTVPSPFDSTLIEYELETPMLGVSIDAQNGSITIDDTYQGEKSEIVKVRAYLKSDHSKNFTKEVEITRPALKSLKIEGKDLLRVGESAQYSLVGTPSNAFVGNPNFTLNTDEYLTQNTQTNYSFKKVSPEEGTILSTSVDGINASLKIITAYQITDDIVVNLNPKRSELVKGDKVTLSFNQEPKEAEPVKLTQSSPEAFDITENPDGSYSIQIKPGYDTTNPSTAVLTLTSGDIKRTRDILLRDNYTKIETLDNIKLSSEESAQAEYTLTQGDDGRTTFKFSAVTTPTPISTGIISWSLRAINPNSLPAGISIVSSTGELFIEEDYNQNSSEFYVVASYDGSSASIEKRVQINKPVLSDINIIGSRAVIKNHDVKYTLEAIPKNAIISNPSYSLDSTTYVEQVTGHPDTLRFKQESGSNFAKLTVTSGAISKTIDINTKYAPTTSIKAIAIPKRDELAISDSILIKVTVEPESAQPPVLKTLNPSTAVDIKDNNDGTFTLTGKSAISNLELIATSGNQSVSRMINIVPSYTKVERIDEIVGDSIIKQADSGDTEKVYTLTTEPKIATVSPDAYTVSLKENISGVSVKKDTNNQVIISITDEFTQKARDITLVIKASHDDSIIKEKVINIQKPLIQSITIKGDSTITLGQSSTPYSIEYKPDNAFYLDEKLNFYLDNEDSVIFDESNPRILKAIAITEDLKPAILKATYNSTENNLSVVREASYNIKTIYEATTSINANISIKDPDYKVALDNAYIIEPIVMPALNTQSVDLVINENPGAALITKLPNGSFEIKANPSYFTSSNEVDIKFVLSNDSLASEEYTRTLYKYYDKVKSIDAINGPGTIIQNPSGQTSINYEIITTPKVSIDSIDVSLNNGGSGISLSSPLSYTENGIEVSLLISNEFAKEIADIGLKVQAKNPVTPGSIISTTHPITIKKPQVTSFVIQGNEIVKKGTDETYSIDTIEPKNAYFDATKVIYSLSDETKVRHKSKDEMNILSFVEKGSATLSASYQSATTLTPVIINKSIRSEYLPATSINYEITPSYNRSEIRKGDTFKLNVNVLPSDADQNINIREENNNLKISKNTDGSYDVSVVDSANAPLKLKILMQSDSLIQPIVEASASLDLVKAYKTLISIDEINGPEQITQGDDEEETIFTYNVKTTPALVNSSTFNYSIAPPIPEGISIETISVENGLNKAKLTLNKDLQKESQNIEIIAKSIDGSISRRMQVQVNKPSVRLLEIQGDDVIYKGKQDGYTYSVNPIPSNAYVNMDEVQYLTPSTEYLNYDSSLKQFSFKEKTPSGTYAKIQAKYKSLKVAEKDVSTAYQNPVSLKANYSPNRSELALNDSIKITPILVESTPNSAMPPSLKVEPNNMVDINKNEDGSYDISIKEGITLPVNISVSLNSSDINSKAKIITLRNDYTKVEALSDIMGASTIIQNDIGDTEQTYTVTTTPSPLAPGTISWKVENPPVGVSINNAGVLNISPSFKGDKIVTVTVSVVPSDPNLATISKTKDIKIIKPTVTSLTILGPDKVYKGSEATYSVVAEPSNAFLDASKVIYSLDKNTYLNVNENRLSFVSETPINEKSVLSATYDGASGSKNIVSSYVDTESLSVNYTPDRDEIVGSDVINIRATILSNNAAPAKLSASPDALIITKIDDENYQIRKRDGIPSNTTVTLTISSGSKQESKVIKILDAYTKAESASIEGLSVINQNNSGDTIIQYTLNTTPSPFSLDSVEFSLSEEIAGLSITKAGLLVIDGSLYNLKDKKLSIKAKVVGLEEELVKEIEIKKPALLGLKLLGDEYVTKGVQSLYYTQAVPANAYIGEISYEMAANDFVKLVTPGSSYVEFNKRKSSSESDVGLLVATSSELNAFSEVVSTNMRIKSKYQDTTRVELFETDSNITLVLDEEPTLIKAIAREGENVEPISWKVVGDNSIPNIILVDNKDASANISFRYDSTQSKDTPMPTNLRAVATSGDKSIEVTINLKFIPHSIQISGEKSIRRDSILNNLPRYQAKIMDIRGNDISNDYTATFSSDNTRVRVNSSGEIIGINHANLQDNEKVSLNISAQSENVIQTYPVELVPSLRFLGALASSLGGNDEIKPGPSWGNKLNAWVNQVSVFSIPNEPLPYSLFDFPTPKFKQTGGKFSQGYVDFAKYKDSQGRENFGSVLQPVRIYYKDGFKPFQTSTPEEETLTISQWVRKVQFRNTPIWQYLSEISSPSANHGSYGFVYNPKNTHDGKNTENALGVDSGNSALYGSDEANAIAKLSSNEWVHLVYTLHGGRKVGSEIKGGFTGNEIYIDGEKLDTRVLRTKTSGTNDIFISSSDDFLVYGGSSDGGTNFNIGNRDKNILGEFSEVRVYYGDITEDEVRQLFQTNKIRAYGK